MDEDLIGDDPKGNKMDTSQAEVSKSTQSTQSTVRITRGSETARKSGEGIEAFDGTVARVKDLAQALEQKLEDWAVTTRKGKGEKNEIKKIVNDQVVEIETELAKIIELYHSLHALSEEPVYTTPAIENDEAREQYANAMEQWEIQNAEWDSAIERMGLETVGQIVSEYETILTELYSRNRLIYELKRKWNIENEAELLQLNEMPMDAPERGMLVQRYEAAELKLKELEQSAKQEISILKRQLNRESIIKRVEKRGELQFSNLLSFCPPPIVQREVEISQEKQQMKGTKYERTHDDWGSTMPTIQTRNVERGYDNSAESRHTDDNYYDSDSNRDSIYLREKRKRKREID